MTAPTSHTAQARSPPLGLSVRAESEKFDISDIDLGMISVGVRYTFL